MKQQFQTEAAVTQMVLPVASETADPRVETQTPARDRANTKVDQLVSTLRRHAQVQKVFRWGGTLLGVSTLSTLAATYASVYFPALGPRIFSLFPFHHTSTVMLSPQQIALQERLMRLANPATLNHAVHVTMGPTATITRLDLQTPTLLMLGC